MRVEVVALNQLSVDELRARRRAIENQPYHARAGDSKEQQDADVAEQEAQRAEELAILDARISELEAPVPGLWRAQHLDLAELRRVNVTRAERWHDGADEWTGADWSNAMCGEAGEAANMVKKCRRIETGIGQPGMTRDELVYGHGIDLAEAVRRKFNEVSRRHDFPEAL